ncbi:MAG: dihydroorotate dehydrogenase electron transfer subunit [Candidatus Zixiibacteriota bacterium]
MENRALGAGAYLLSIKLKLEQFPHPGEFLHIKPTSEGLDPLLRRAFSIFDFDENTGAIEVLYKVFGRGSAILSRVAPGQILDILGPLGNGFPLPEKSKHLLFVGGGVGIPPIYLLAKTCLRNGHAPGKMTFLMGFCKAEDCRMGERVEQLPITQMTSTDDGSRGQKGFVSDLLRKLLEDGLAGGESVIYACGPEGMLKAIQSLAREFNTRCFLSLESIMPCGVGACLGCVVKQVGEDKYRRVCREGPVFDSTEVEL